MARVLLPDSEIDQRLLEDLLLANHDPSRKNFDREDELIFI